MYGSSATGAAAVAEAIKATGAIIQVEAAVFAQLAAKEKKPLIVIAKGGFMGKGFKYLMGCRGLIFFAKSSEHLLLPGDAEIISAGKIWLPSVC